MAKPVRNLFLINCLCLFCHQSLLTMVIDPIYTASFFSSEKNIYYLFKIIRIPCIIHIYHVWVAKIKRGKTNNRGEYATSNKVHKLAIFC